MKKSRLKGIIICGALVMALGMSACQSSSSGSTQETAAESSQAQSTGTNSITSESSDLTLTGTTISGMVSAVDGNSITLNVMQGAPGGGQAPSGDSNGGTPPEKPDGDDQGAGGLSGDNTPAGGTGTSDDNTSPESTESSGSNSSSDNGSSSDSNSSSDNGSSSDSKSSSDNGSSSDSKSSSDNGSSSDSKSSSDGGSSSESKSSSDSGSSSDSNSSSDNGAPQAPPDASDGQQPSGQPGGDSVTATLVLGDESVLKDSDGSSASLEDITEGKMLQITTDDSGAITAITISDAGQGGPGGQPGGGGQSSAPTSYDAATDVTEDTESTGETYSSTGTDENAVLVENGATAKLKDPTVTRDSDESTGGDNSSFYGVGAAVLTKDGTSYIDGGSITTDAKGAAGAFSYGDGVTYIQNTDIKTSQDTSGGIHVAGGGKLYAWNVNAETDGESSAAIRSDRGGGTMVVDGGTYTSNGTGSPAIYSTADITVNGADLTANGSEAVCIEGLNSVRLYDCDLSGNMSDDNNQNDCTWNVIVYQSMSGDSEQGNGTFSMTGGTLTAKNGGMFYTTNTESTFYLSNVDITYADENDFFLKCTGNSNARGWGESGSNGADCNFTADNQAMEGDIVYDSISQLDFYMENGSSLTGAVIDDESNAGSGGSGYANVYIDSSSTWTVTADSSVTALYNEGTIVDSDGNTVSIVGTDGTEYVKGDSDLTVTVGSYSDSADMSGATASDSYDNYSVQNPF